MFHHGVSINSSFPLIVSVYRIFLCFMIAATGEINNDDHSLLIILWYMSNLSSTEGNSDKLSYTDSGA